MSSPSANYPVDDFSAPASETNENSENTAANRFWAKVDRSGGPRACWRWIRAIDAVGYGAAWDPGQGRVRKAHRMAYEFVRGPIPGNLPLDHLCRNRACVNPAHMDPVTIGENLLRGETVTARNAAKTHCLNGHEFTPENIYCAPGKPAHRRECRACIRQRSAELVKKRSAVRLAKRQAARPLPTPIASFSIDTSTATASQIGGAS